MTVPPSLAALPNWVAWKRESVRGKPTKVPYKARGEHASVTDPTTWTPLADARAACARGRFDGIGFVITGTPYTGIDLDWHDRPGDDMPPVALELIARFDSYAERTPSGKGARILIRGKLPAGARHKVTLEDGVTLEAYSEARYFTVTGDRLTDHTDPQDRQAELDQLVTERLTRVPRRPAPARPATVPVDLADADLLEKARSATNGARFQALWDGDLTAYAGDHSRADYALVNALVFWTNGDAARTDRLFRSSRLMRDKWDQRHHGDGRTYGQGTIDNALASWDGVGYTARGQASSPDGTTAEQVRGRYGPAVLERARTVLCAAQAHARTRNGYLETTAHIYELASDPNASRIEPEGLIVTLGGLRNIASVCGGKPEDHARRLQYLEPIGAVGRVRRQDPRNPRSPLEIVLPLDPKDLGIYQLDREASKRLTLKPARQRPPKRVTDAQTSPMVGHRLSTRAPTEMSHHGPYRARWTGLALQASPATTTAKLALEAGLSVSTVRSHLRTLQQEGLAQREGRAWSLTVTPAEYRAEMRRARESDPRYRAHALSLQRARLAYHQSRAARLPARLAAPRALAARRAEGVATIIHRLEAGEPVYALMGAAA